jgi:beta-glucosidase
MSIKLTYSLVLAVFVSLFMSVGAEASERNWAQPVLGSRGVPIIKKDGLRFKDLNRNGRLDPYEDWRLASVERARDLLRRMSLEEKAGLLVLPVAPANELLGPIDIGKLARMVQNGHIRFFNNYSSNEPLDMARSMNAAQAIAENQPLGIPITFASNPRNQFSVLAGQLVAAGKFSKFPDPIGLTATGDPDLVRKFGRIAASELRATGIRVSLSPQADLATEPRWFRGSGGFGADPIIAGKFVAAYVEGFQHGAAGVDRDGVATVVKHWVGYGASPNGVDAALYDGRYLKLTNNSLQYHVAPFLAAFRVHAAGVMPTYGMPAPGLTIGGKEAEPVGASFSRQMVHDLLRNKYHYDGFVLTDFMITSDCLAECKQGTMELGKIGYPWGVEDLTREERFARALNAGCNQIGGVADSDIVTNLVREGKVAVSKLDASAFRLLKLKFQLGEFEDPYVDLARVNSIVGSKASKDFGLQMQRRSQVLLKDDGKLPSAAKRGARVWLWNIDPSVLGRYGFQLAASPESADFSILRVQTPFELRPHYLFSAFVKGGPLSFGEKNPDGMAIERAAQSGKPVAVVVRLDRAAILSNIAPRADILVADFGASDEAVLDMLTGKQCYSGRLPFELPSSVRPYRISSLISQMRAPAKPIHNASDTSAKLPSM